MVLAPSGAANLVAERGVEVTPHETRSRHGFFWKADATQKRLEPGVGP